LTPAGFLLRALRLRVMGFGRLDLWVVDGGDAGVGLKVRESVLEVGNFVDW